MRLGFISLAWMTLTALAAGQEQPGPALKYPLSDREGPWLVHVGSFRGDDALAYANNLAEEVRAKHRLLSFVFSMEDQAAKQERDLLRQQQLQMIGADKAAGTDEKLKLRTVRVVKEYSVFVGNFKDMHEARIEAAKVKEFPPPTSIPSYGVHVYEEPTERVRTDPAETEKFGIFASRLPTKEVQGTKKGQVQGNIYRQAFVCRNPIVAQQHPAAASRTQQNQLDPSLRLLNEKEKYSIFTCPKPWTLVVAVFKPPSDIRGAVGNVLQANYNPQAQGKYLEYVAEQARQMADLLRDGGRGYDAYVMHTNNYSIVTVGAFDSRTDGNMEKAWEALVNFAATQKTGPYSCLIKVPQPMQVPGK